MQKLIKTILSRAQLFKIRQFSDEEIKLYLSKHDEVSESEVDQAIYLSEGNLNQANKLLQVSDTDELII